MKDLPLIKSSSRGYILFRPPSTDTCIYYTLLHSPCRVPKHEPSRSVPPVSSQVILHGIRNLHNIRPVRWFISPTHVDKTPQLVRDQGCFRSTRFDSFVDFDDDLCVSD